MCSDNFKGLLGSNYIYAVVTLVYFIKVNTVMYKSNKCMMVDFVLYSIG